MKLLIAKTGFFIASLISTQSAFSQTGNADAKLQLPAGFTSTVVAEGLSGARHIAFNKQGGLYIKLSQLRDGKGIVYLKDTNGDGVFDKQTAFGDYPGTGIYVKG